MSDETTARRLLGRLDQEWEWPPPALLEEVIACGEAAVRPLEELLTPKLFAAAQDDDKAGLLSYYALGLLGSLKAPAALPPLLRALPLVDDDTLDWMWDWIFPLGPDAIGPLLGVATDEAVGLYPRTLAAEIAADLADSDPGRRARVADALRPVLADYSARFDALTDDQTEILNIFASQLAVLADPPSRPLIEAALAADQLDPMHIDRKLLEEMYAQGGLMDPPRAVTPWLDRYREDYQTHQAARLFEADDEDPVQEPVVLGKRLGRNDPCWCGSGQKYKKCHLAADEKEGRA